MKELVILEEDKKFAQDRIAQLEREILELGPEFHEAFNQSSETWHDNAPFDALRERQAMLDAERQKLRRILQQASVAVPKLTPGIVSIGGYVEIDSGDKYFIAGHWTPRAGQTLDGSMIISASSPLGSCLLGKRAGEVFFIGKQEIKINCINYAATQ